MWSCVGIVSLTWFVWVAVVDLLSRGRGKASSTSSVVEGNVGSWSLREEAALKLSLNSTSRPIALNRNYAAFRIGLAFNCDVKE
jgi:hypothetical protein